MACLANLLKFVFDWLEKNFLKETDYFKIETYPL